MTDQLKFFFNPLEFRFCKLCSLNCSFQLLFLHPELPVEYFMCADFSGETLIQSSFNHLLSSSSFCSLSEAIFVVCLRFLSNSSKVTSLFKHLLSTTFTCNNGIRDACSPVSITDCIKA